MPARCRCASTSEARFACTRLWAERLTDTRRSIQRQLSSAAAAKARPKTWSVMVPMSPMASAMAMNSSGFTAPSTGWFQRTRASAPTGRPLARLTCGWNTKSSSPFSTARCMSATRPRRRLLLWSRWALSSGAARYSGRYSSTPEWSPLATYIAASARCISTPTSEPCSGPTATPMLAPTSTVS